MQCWSQKDGQDCSLYMWKTGAGEDEGYGQQVTCNTYIEETPVETNSKTCIHLTPDKFFQRSERKQAWYTCSYLENCYH